MEQQSNNVVSFDVEGLFTEAVVHIGNLLRRCMFLSAQNKALQSEITALKSEIAEMKKAQPKE